VLGKIPTAWLQLKHEKLRFFVALSGISFAVVLIFMQLGLRAALFDSGVALHRSLKGDIFLISVRSTSLIAMDSFSERYLNRTLALTEVESINPIYLGFAQWKNPQTKNSWRSIYVIGYDLSSSVFNLPGVDENKEKLKLPNVVLFDSASRSEFGPVVDMFGRNGLVSTEIGDRGPGNRKIAVEGLFRLGTSFGADGNLITSNLNFLRIFTIRPSGYINIGLIKLKPGYDIDITANKLRKFLTSDVQILTKEEFINKELQYWDTTTPIGFVFFLGVVLGLIVGVIIVYQILYNNVSEHLSEYATLKAIGYNQAYLRNVVFQESLILAFLGYIPGFLITLGMYKIAKDATLLPVKMEIGRAVIVLILTFVMCLVSGAIAIGKLQDADPADIF
jgi:putative ABC transport system permease protein